MSGDLTRRDALTLGAAATVLAAASPRLANRAGPVFAAGPAGLRARADAKGLICGAEVNHQPLRDDPRVGAALIEDANSLVPDLELKWSRLQPTPGPIRFEPAEAILRFAEAHRMTVRGHTLTWYRGQPAWAQELIPALSAGKVGDMLERYVHDVVSRFRGRIVHWDVANEPVDGAGRLTEKLFSAKLGEQYIDLAFRAARDADPDALLVLNTDFVEQDTVYQERHRHHTLRLLERLKARGVAVQALGIESHLSTLYPFSEARFRSFLDEAAGMGLKLIATEFDVSDFATLGGIAQRDAATAALGKAYLDVMLANPACLGFLTWGQSDRYSWLRLDDARPRADRSPLRPLPRDDAFQRKPLWHAIAAAIDAAPSRRA
jgi:endo-1,4-beta-xylanase